MDGDIENYFSKRNVWIDQASIAGIAFFDNVEVSVVGLVGGVASNDKIVTQRVNGYVEHWKIHQVIYR